MMERIRRRWLESRFLTAIPPTPPPNFFSELVNWPSGFLHVTEYARLTTPLGPSQKSVLLILWKTCTGPEIITSHGLREIG